MGIAELQKFAEKLRQFVADNSAIKGRGYKVTLDGAPAEGKSIDLQINQGQCKDTYLDGTRIMWQPFILFCRDTATGSNEEKSEMIGLLNAAGCEMESGKLPEFGPGIDPFDLEMLGTANIAERDDQIIGYQAVFMLKYEQSSA